jgi:hypothetical protein
MIHTCSDVLYHTDDTQMSQCCWYIVLDHMTDIQRYRFY